MSAPLPLVISGIPLQNTLVGVGVYSRRLIEALIRQAGAEVNLTVLLPETLPPGSLPWLPDSVIERIPDPRPRLPDIIQDARRFNRMVHTAGHRHPGAIFHSPGPAWAAARGPNTVVTIHDCIYRRFPLYLGRLVIRKQLVLATERYAASARRVLTDSRCSADDLVKLARFPAAKIDVVYPWVGPEFDAQSACASAATVAAKYKLPASYWLYLGGYDYRKNVEILIRAYAEAARSAMLPPLVLAGKIPQAPHPTQCDILGALRAAALPADTVIMPGRVDDADLPGLYAGASLFIYPSLYEGFGLPPAEAMAVGTPVLVSDGSSLVEVVTNPASRFDPTTSAPLVTKLQAASRDPSQFRAPLLPAFTEAAGIQSYLAALSRLL